MQWGITVLLLCLMLCICSGYPPKYASNYFDQRKYLNSHRTMEQGHARAGNQWTSSQSSPPPQTCPFVSTPSPDVSARVDSAVFVCSNQGQVCHHTSLGKCCHDQSIEVPGGGTVVLGSNNQQVKVEFFYSGGGFGSGKPLSVCHKIHGSSGLCESGLFGCEPEDKCDPDDPICAGHTIKGSCNPEPDPNKGGGCDCEEGFQPPHCCDCTNKHYKVFTSATEFTCEPLCSRNCATPPHSLGCDSCKLGYTGPGCCDCDTGFLKVDGECPRVCRVSCQNGFFDEDTGCAPGRCREGYAAPPLCCNCTDEFERDPVTGLCRRRVPDCDPPEALNTLENKCCPSGQVFDQQSQRCQCPQGEDYNPVTEQCCPLGQTYFPATQQCGCPEGQEYDSTAQRCCPRGQRFDFDTRQCRCPQDRDYNPVAQECCPVGQTYISSSRQCGCPDGRDYNPVAQECCPVGQTYISSSRQCGCPDGRDYNPVAQECCPVGQTYISSSRQCGCPGGRDYNPRRMICCPPGEVYDSASGDCKRVCGGNQDIFFLLDYSQTFNNNPLHEVVGSLQYIAEAFRENTDINDALILYPVTGSLRNNNGPARFVYDKSTNCPNTVKQLNELVEADSLNYDRSTSTASYEALQFIADRNLVQSGRRTSIIAIQDGHSNSADSTSRIQTQISKIKAMNANTKFYGAGINTETSSNNQAAARRELTLLGENSDRQWFYVPSAQFTDRLVRLLEDNNILCPPGVDSAPNIRSRQNEKPNGRDTRLKVYSNCLGNVPNKCNNERTEEAYFSCWAQETEGCPGERDGLDVTCNSRRNSLMSDILTAVQGVFNEAFHSE